MTVQFNCITGLRRSGTSLMMLMLRTAGVPILGQKYAVHTNFNTPISDKELYGNKTGYWEMGGISCLTGLRKNHLILGLDQDVIKVVADCLYYSEPETVNKIIYMKRQPRYTIASLLKSNLFEEKDIEAVIEKSIIDTTRTLDFINTFKKDYLSINYEDVLKDPLKELTKATDFLKKGNSKDGAKVVDKTLNRSQPLAGDYDRLEELEELIKSI